MKKSRVVASVAACLVLADCAAPVYTFDPMPVAGETVKYLQGVSTTYAESKNTAVQITPMGLNDDRVGFGVAIFNKSNTPIDFGTDDVHLTENGQPLKVMTAEELQHEAKVKAEWATALMILAGAAAAASANANAYSHTNGYIATPYGITTFHATTYDPGVAQVNLMAAGAATGAGLVAIHSSLEDRLAHINGDVLQRNTVAPSGTAGGEIISDDLADRSFPKGIQIDVVVNGEDHVFNYTVTKQ